MKRKVQFILMFSLFGAPAIPPSDTNSFCETSKEFITANEFLRTEKQYFRSADLSVATAKKVAEGCTGAAARFIKTIRALEKTDLTIGEILSAAEQSALKSEATSEAFLKIFSRLYASDDFDFDLSTSLKMARALSVDFKGEAEVALKDFEAISKFCLKTENLNFGKAKCAEVAQAVALTSETHHLPTADSFSNSYLYLTSEKGPAMTSQEAIKQTKELIQIHPAAVTNFKTAYDYAASEKGLGVNRTEAIKFAKLMASKTLSAESKSPAEAHSRVK